jgi:hypothetical protein
VVARGIKRDRRKLTATNRLRFRLCSGSADGATSKSPAVRAVTFRIES